MSEVSEEKDCFGASRAYTQQTHQTFAILMLEKNRVALLDLLPLQHREKRVLQHLVTILRHYRRKNVCELFREVEIEMKMCELFDL